jgi:hypothetical protein
MSHSTYQFPRTIFRHNKIIDQIIHLRSELEEVQVEIVKRDHSATAREVWDVIHSAETALRILENQHGVNVEEARFLVLAGNAGRGYYE